jgi:PQQ-dependent catabolism-associated CXXCW motif protein
MIVRMTKLARRIARVSAIVLCVAAGLIGERPVFAAGENETYFIPDEPQTYRMDEYLSPTPATLAGVKVVSTAEAYAIWLEGKTLFVDVMPRPVKPANLPADVIWRDKPHDSLPLSPWLPNVGYGKLSAEIDAYFRKNLERLTGEDKHTPVLFYCKSECWMSWNAAKRAREEYGYDTVLWYPAGVDGWASESHELKPAHPEP